MEWTISQDYLQWIKRITCQYTILHCSLETFLNWRDKFLRNITTLHFIDKLQSTLSKVFINRTNCYDNISEFTATTGLFLINFTQFNSLCNSFLVVNLRFTLITFYFKFTFQAVDNNIQVELTHTRDDSLTWLLISFNCKCRVFFSQLSQTVRQLIQVFLCFGLNCNTNNRIREFHRFQYNGCFFVTQSITSTNILETNTCTNITSTN